MYHKFFELSWACLRSYNLSVINQVLKNNHLSIIGSILANQKAGIKNDNLHLNQKKCSNLFPKCKYKKPERFWGARK